MKQVFYSTFALPLASPAFAEVCDKVSPKWDPGSGSIGQIGELYLFMTSPLGIALAVLIAITLYVRKRWLSITCAVFILLLAALMAAMWIWPADTVLHAAQREGCRAVPIVTIGVLTLLFVWLFQYGKPRVSERLNTIDLGDDLDDVEMLMEIEEVFGIKIEDVEAEKLVTMGELHMLVRKKLESKADFDPVWSLICKIARVHSGSRDPIDENTTFFPKFAQERPKMHGSPSK